MRPDEYVTVEAAAKEYGGENDYYRQDYERAIEVAIDKRQIGHIIWGGVELVRWGDVDAMEIRL